MGPRACQTLVIDWDSYWVLMEIGIVGGHHRFIGSVVDFFFIGFWLTSILLLRLGLVD